MAEYTNCGGCDYVIDRIIEENETGEDLQFSFHEIIRCEETPMDSEEEIREWLNNAVESGLIDSAYNLPCR